MPDYIWHNKRRYDVHEKAREAKKQNLPTIGRSLEAFEVLEDAYREALLPNVPTYDLDSGHRTNFDEWTYTDGLDSLLAFTMSQEINLRIAFGAVTFPSLSPTDYGTIIAGEFEDKWKSQDNVDLGALPTEYNVFFSPGSNFRHIVSRNQLVREFDRDRRWVMKPHPVMHNEDIVPEVNKFGVTRILDKGISAATVMRDATKVGYTSTSELGIVAALLGKEVEDFTLYEWEATGRYYTIYRVAREFRLDMHTTINALWNCPWSGYVHKSVDRDEAHRRFLLFKRKSIEVRDQYRPLIARPLPPRPKQK